MLYLVFHLVMIGWRANEGAGGLSAAILAQDRHFWASIATGLGGFVIASWIWALKPGNSEVTLFALSGIATLTFTFSMAPAGAIGVDLPMALLYPLYHINAAGASLFGIVMTVLLVRYPMRLPGHRLMTFAAVLMFGGWTLWALSGPLQRLMVIHTITFVEMLCMCAAVIAQYFAARRRPKDRAIAIWMGICIIIGSGIFIALVAAPIALGFDPLVDERLAFSSFLLVYIGMAVGLTRYKVFELGEWAFYVLFYVAGAVLFIAVDIVLIIVLSLDAAASLGVSLFLVALIYLPMRDLLWRSFLAPKRMEEHTLVQAVIDVAFEPSDAQRRQLWRSLFKRLFDPLEISETDHRGDSAAILDDGAGLYVPATANMSAMALHYPWRGRGLFGPRHLKTGHYLVDIMRRAESGRQAYDHGVTEERMRIARDMHDNIGAQLLSALHSPLQDRKNMLIGQTLSDLRDIIRNATRPALPVEEALADLRAETADRLEPAGLTLIWTAQGNPAATLTPDTTHALRSLIREGVSNVIRHSSGTTASITIDYTGAQIGLEISDDGSGFNLACHHDGVGLQSMKARVDALKGDFKISGTEQGTRIRARLPLDQTPIAAQ